MKLISLKKSILGVASLVLATGLANSSAAPVAVTAAGLSTSTNNTWITDGAATLNGATSGVDWQAGAGQGGGGDDWVFAGGYSQASLATTTVEWPSPGTFFNLGYVVDPVDLNIGTTMASDVLASGGLTLRIAEVAPAAGDFTLNGVTQTATAAGQVLLWTTPEASLIVGDSLNFTSDASLAAVGTISAGPIGFSAISTIDAPEPSTWVLMLGGLSFIVSFQILRRRQFNP